MKNSMSFSIAGFALACAAGVAHADIITPDPYALGGDRQYHQTGGPTRFHIDSFFDVFVDCDFTWSGAPHDPPLPGAGPSYGESDGTVSLRISLNGLPPGEPWLGTLHSSFVDVFTGVSPDGETQYFDTEMLSLDLHATGTLSDGSNHDIMLRCKPVRGAHGAYFRRNYIRKDFADSGDPQLFQINSFFDIFTELSLDGGQTWTDSDTAMHVELVGPTVPAPGVSGFLALSGAFAARRRRH
ncbi:MAG: hypothetical protein K8R92_08980 [Planctomycetes bacterium]|nr:hypothetical protein [Planctomycetota bacterium]